MSTEQDPNEAVELAKQEAALGDEAHKLMQQASEPAATETPTEERVDDEQADQLAKLAQRLIADNKGIQQCMGTMVAARQLYAMAVREMGYQFEKLPEEDQHELLLEFLSQAAGHQAAKPFDENELFYGFQETVYPWMVAVTKEHNELEEKERVEDEKAWETDRRARQIPIGITFDPVLQDTLPRDRTLVLAGWRPAVRYVLDKIVTNVMTDNKQQLFYVIRLMLQMEKEETQLQLLRLGKEHWTDCCKNNKSWPMLFQSLIMSQLASPPDVLVCDDLPNAALPVVGGAGTPGRQANHAHKRFRDWCLKVGCGFVGAIPVESQSPLDLSTAEWEPLRTWSCLRPVWVKDSEDQPLHYDVFVGRDYLVASVPKKTLDNYGEVSRIIT